MQTTSPTKYKQIKYRWNEKFKEDEMNELKKAFSVYENSSDNIDPNNILKILIDLGYDKDNPSVINLMQYLSNETSVLNKKLISFNQFLEGVYEFLGKNSDENDIEKTFDMFKESETNGIITLESLKKVINNFGEEINDTDLEKIFSCNAGEKMFLTYADFVKIFKKN